MTEFLRDWMPAIAFVLAPTAGVIAARWNRKSQAEANTLTGSGQIFTHQSTLLQDIQEEKDKAKAELKEEREAHKRDFQQLRKEFEEFKKEAEVFRETVQTQFSKFRSYIHKLRGQVHDLGGIPHEWPADLDQ